MRSPLPIGCSLLLFAAFCPLRAEFSRVDLTVSGLDCASCASSVNRVLQKIKGVESANFEFKESLAMVQLKAGNTVRLEQIKDAVKGVGYTPQAAKVTARGKVEQTGGKWKFRLSGIEREYELDLAGSSGVKDKIQQETGGEVIVEGSIAPGAPEILKVSSLRRGN